MKKQHIECLFCVVRRPFIVFVQRLATLAAQATLDSSAFVGVGTGGVGCGASWQLGVIERVAAMAAPPTIEYEALPHTGYLTVGLCPFAKVWRLFHSVTMAHVDVPVLPDGLQAREWSLEFDAEGYGTLRAYIGNDFVAFDVGDILPAPTVYRAAGRLYFCVGDDASAPRMQSVDGLDAQHVVREAVLCKVGLQRVDLVIPVALFHRRRVCGCKVMWSMPGLFKAMQGDALGHIAGQWLGKMLPSWLRYLGKLRLCACIKAQQRRDRAENPDSADHTRVLPWIVMSTLCVLLVACRLARPHTFQGGIKHKEVRFRLQLIVKHLLSSMKHLGPFELPLCLGVRASVRPWPQLPTGGSPLVCRVANGMVDCAVHRHPHGSDSALSRVVPRSGGMSADDLVFGLIAEAGTEPLLEQVLVGFGRRIDESLVAAACGDQGSSHQPKTVVIRASEFDGNGMQDSQLESTLSAELRGFRAAAEAHVPLMISLGPDKSRVGSLGLQNCPAVLPNNIATVLPPRVGHGVVSGGGGGPGRNGRFKS